MKLTKEQAIAEHRKMWRWIAEETERRKCVVGKEEYTYGFDEPICNNCFCCEYNKHQHRRYFADCRFCPLDWSSSSRKFMCEYATEIRVRNGIYGRWAEAVMVDDWQTAAALARQIAELPEREVGNE